MDKDAPDIQRRGGEQGCKYAAMWGQYGKERIVPPELSIVCLF